MERKNIPLRITYFHKFTLPVQNINEMVRDYTKNFRIEISRPFPPFVRTPGTTLTPGNVSTEDYEKAPP
jgi:hypothetical protein